VGEFPAPSFFLSSDSLSLSLASQIECTEAVENFADILSESDGIMVARGDLGVEIPMEQVGISCGYHKHSSR
jgi:pyruvate kinase